MTQSCPFCDCSRQFAYGPWNVKTINLCHKRAFQEEVRANFGQFSNLFHFFLFEMMVDQARSRDFVQLLNLLLRQFATSFSTLIRVTFSIVSPRDSFCVRVLPPKQLSVVPAENRDSNMFLCSSIILSFDFHSR